jgi:hypothetical protein
MVVLMGRSGRGGSSGSSVGRGSRDNFRKGFREETEV